MEIHRVLLAVVLSLAILVAWNIFFPATPPEQPEEEPEVVEEPLEEPHPEEDPRTEPLEPEEPREPTEHEIPEFEAVEGEQIQVETPLYQATFNTAGGVLEHFKLKDYKQSIEPDAPHVDLVTPRSLARGPMGIIWNDRPTWEQGEWAFEGDDLQLEPGEEKTLTFTGRVGDLKIVRELTFLADTYKIQENIELVNTSSASATGTIGQVLASPKFSDSRLNPTEIAYYDLDGLNHEGDSFQKDSQFQWAGIGDKYFLLAMVPSSPDVRLDGDYRDDMFQVNLSKEMSLSPETAYNLDTVYYLGPKDRTYLDEAPNKLGESIYYGWFDLLSQPLMRVLNFFYDYVGNYGIAILLLTLVIKIIFWPLSHKSYKSMNQMKKLQPIMTKIREKYKDDRKKMNEEMMRLYRTYKVNPLGGCLPIVVQIPVFIALYQGLLGSVELRHAPFISHIPFTDIVWLADLSSRDPYFITPILMGATMFLQQRMAPAPGDPMQAKLMQFLPLVFTFIFMTFPSGLVIYWLANNVLSIGQQWYMLKSADMPLKKAEEKEGQKTDPDTGLPIEDETQEEPESKESAQQSAQQDQQKKTGPPKKKKKKKK